MFDNRRPLRAQSVQPLLHQENLTGKANFHAKRFNTSYKSPRSERWVNLVGEYFNTC